MYCNNICFIQALYFIILTGSKNGVGTSDEVSMLFNSTYISVQPFYDSSGSHICKLVGLTDKIVQTCFAYILVKDFNISSQYCNLHNKGIFMLYLARIRIQANNILEPFFQTGMF